MTHKNKRSKRKGNKEGTRSNPHPNMDQLLRQAGITHTQPTNTNENTSNRSHSVPERLSASIDSELNMIGTETITNNPLSRDLQTHFASTSDLNTQNPGDTRRRLSATELMRNVSEEFHSTVDLVTSPESVTNNNNSQLTQPTQTHEQHTLHTNLNNQVPPQLIIHTQTPTIALDEPYWRKEIYKRVISLEQSREQRQNDTSNIANVVNDLSAQIHKVDMRAENNCLSHTKAVELSLTEKLLLLKQDANITADILASMQNTQRDIALKQVATTAKLDVHEGRIDFLQEKLQQMETRPAGQGGISPVKFSPPIFNGTSTDRPIQYLKKLKQFLENTPIPQSQQCIVVSNSLKNSAAEWFSYINLNPFDIDAFEARFIARYWSDDIQYHIRDQLSMGYYDSSSNMSMVDYITRMSNDARDLLPPYSDRDIIRLLSRHFTEEIKNTILSRKYETTDELINYFSSIENVGTVNKKEKVPFANNFKFSTYTKQSSNNSWKFSQQQNQPSEQQSNNSFYRNNYPQQNSFATENPVQHNNIKQTNVPITRPAQDSSKFHKPQYKPSQNAFVNACNYSESIPEENIETKVVNFQKGDECKLKEMLGQSPQGNS